jgi:hypothetical protein
MGPLAESEGTQVEQRSGPTVSVLNFRRSHIPGRFQPKSDKVALFDKILIKDGANSMNCGGCSCQHETTQQLEFPAATRVVFLNFHNLLNRQVRTVHQIQPNQAWIVSHELISAGR